MHCNKHDIALLSRMSANKSLLKALVLFSGITVVLFIYFVRNTTIINRSLDTAINDVSHSLHGANNQLDSFQRNNEAVDNLRRPFNKIFLAFGYWEQPTAATNNFLDLRALAAYGGQQIVVPSVTERLVILSPTDRGEF